MKLLYFINQITNSGGIERIVIDKINYLAALPGYSVSLVYFGTAEDKTFYKMDSSIKLCPIKGYTHTSSFMQRIGGMGNVFRQTCKIIKAEAPDMIVTANAYIVSWVLPFIFRSIPKIVELHFSYGGLMIMNKEIYHGNNLKCMFNTWLRKTIYPLYDKCVVLTEDDVKQWNFKNCICIPNFSNIKNSKNVEKRREKKAIAVGRLEPVKDHDILIEAWRYVEHHYPDWKLEIWGDGSLKSRYEDKIRKLHLSGNVFLKGTSTNIIAQYHQASFLVLSSVYEGHPLVVIEAMQCGIPCVSFSIPATHNLIINNVNGYLVTQRTPESLAEKIIEMIESEQAREAMGKEAIKMASRFDKEVIMQKWIKLFEKLSNEDCN